MSSSKARELALSKLKDSVDILQADMQARDVIRYQITGPDEQGQCRMTIVELTAGWHKGIRDKRAILDINTQAVAGFSYSHTPGERLDSKVFARASIEASSHLGKGLDMSLGKAEASSEYNPFFDEWKNDVSVSKPRYRGKGKGFQVEADKVVNYGINAKIVSINIKRKNCT
ncbi:hypothetical protein KDW99_01540 [Marinomonas rhizomae]|uniref:hypothetical protein n=1 Tax=Marinomonas rhizomae TaxID=491948 RepID=UPI0021070769|nr:hypothetical protein [Marinomonas rhizomae]UTV99860.1 hypothetical protein KDW99_01540 [Marinomonas rhizomae]